MSELALTVRQVVGSEKIRERDALAEGLIERSGSYLDLRADLDVDGAADNYPVGLNLFQGGHFKLDELGRAAELYFKFRPRFFRNSVGRKQRVRDFFRNPFPHSDLEEEEIEEKFPDDIRRRALLKALNFVLVRNQVTHILRKRTYQAAYTLATSLVGAAWLIFGHDILQRNQVVIDALAMARLNSPVAVLALWAVSFLLLVGAVFVVSQAFYERDLENTTDRFKKSNEAACAKASENMTNFSKEVGERFSNFLGAIKGSEDHLEIVQDQHWPAHSREIFRIALWDAKRVESIEKFWQLQFERLRIYELVLDRIGNFSSVGLAWTMSALAALGLLIWALLDYSMATSAMAVLGFLTVHTIAHRFGKISRREKLSFDMDDIINQGIETRWPPFSNINYYDRIAQEIENGLGAKRIIKIQNIFQNR